MSHFEWLETHLTPPCRILISDSMKPVTKRRLKWALGVIGFLVLCRLVLPVPLRGNWIGYLTEHMCDEHAFIKYADGKATFYHDLDRPNPYGTYTRIGWQTYWWDGAENKGKPIIVHPGWVFVRYEGVGTNGTVWGVRDLLFGATARIIRESEAMPPKGNAKQKRRAE